MYYETFRLLCEKKGIKPSDVSKATGISTATLTNWKQGKYTPKYPKLKAIADFFDVPVSDLMVETVVMNKDVYKKVLQSFSGVGIVPDTSPMKKRADMPDIIQKYFELPEDDKKEIDMLIELKSHRMKKEGLG